MYMSRLPLCLANHFPKKYLQRAMTIVPIITATVTVTISLMSLFVSANQERNQTDYKFEYLITNSTISSELKIYDNVNGCKKHYKNINL